MMKNFIFKTMNGKVALQVMSMVVLSIFLVSCEKEDSGLADQPDNAEMAIFNILETGVSKSIDATETQKRAAPAPGDDAIAVIAINGGFGELVEALMYVDEKKDSGLVDLFLNGTDQFTVFAPTDEAFHALYDVLEVEGIRELPADLVLNVLLYHVTEGRRAANSVVPKKNVRKIETLLGETFKVDNNGMIWAIGSNAGIVAADISASNGIIHVIDSVLLPIE